MKQVLLLVMVLISTVSGLCTGFTSETSCFWWEVYGGNCVQDQLVLYRLAVLKDSRFSESYKVVKFGEKYRLDFCGQIEITQEVLDQLATCCDLNQDGVTTSREIKMVYNRELRRFFRK